MLMRELIDMHKVATVIQLSSVSKEMCIADHEEPPEELRALVTSYIITRDSNEPALKSILSGMARRKGCAHMLSGAYGTGKSHMIALIGLLCQFRWARELFKTLNEGFSDAVDKIGEHKWLVVSITLDAYSPRLPLEQIFWEETIVALKRSNELVANKIPLQMPPSRAEAMKILQDTAIACGYDSILWLVDELSMFLGAKTHSELQADASFLQFIAQYCQHAPSWLIVAIQKTIEEMGELEAYSLTQIKDRYIRHQLSLTHIRQLIRKNLLPPKDENKFRQFILQWHRNLVTSFPMLEFSAEELAACYPFHPITILCLERAVGRFFSRTRSAVEFIQTIVNDVIDGDAFQLITPDCIFEHFRPDILTHPDLHVYADEVIPYLDGKVNEIAPERKTSVEKLARTLVVFKIAGIDATVRRLTHTFLWDFGLGWEMNYSYMLSLLETLRTNVNYIACSRRGEEYDDIYVIDLGTTLTEMMQRRLNALLDCFSDEDIRVVEYALQTLSSAQFAIPKIGSGRTATVEWHNVDFTVMLQCADLRNMTEKELLNIVHHISSPACSYDIHLLIVPPIAISEQERRATELIHSIKNERFKEALVILIPKPIGKGEMMRLMENTAAAMLLEDPTLRDSDIGMAIYQRLREEEVARRNETLRIISNAYLHGTLITVDRKLPVSALLPMNASFKDVLIAVVGASVPKAFPSFMSIAPSIRLRQSDELRKLVNAILAGEEIQTLSADVQELWRHVAIPLGITKQSLQYYAPLEGAMRLAYQCIAEADSPLPYEHVSALLQKSEYALRKEQCELLIAVLLRRGEVMALDRYGNTLPINRLSSPLTKCIGTLCPSYMVEGSVWEAATSYAQAVGISFVEREETASQMALWQKLKSWGHETSIAHEHCSTLLNLLVTELRHSNAMWAKSFGSLATINTAINAIAEDATPQDGLKEFVLVLQANGIKPEELKEAHDEFKNLHTLLSENYKELRRMHTWLTHSDLQLTGELKMRAEGLLTLLDEGEGMLTRLNQLLALWKSLQVDYAKQYLEHHRREHATSRFEPYVRLRRNATFKLLHRLTQIRIPMQSIDDALKAVNVELSKQCHQQEEQLSNQLMDTPVCKVCKLRLAEHVELIPPERILEIATNASREAKAFLSSCDIRSKVEAFAEAMPASLTRRRLEKLLSLTPDDSDEMWLEALSDDVIECINLAISHEPAKIRVLNTLLNRFAGKEMTKAEAIKTFVSWLDEPSPLKPFEQVRFTFHQGANEETS
ncbi:MAG: hypothetical protein RUDDFDWM_001487 [Candidatus Fervidibacterota bacterium]